jgi:hypothetical protein
LGKSALTTSVVGVAGVSDGNNEVNEPDGSLKSPAAISALLASNVADGSSAVDVGIEAIETAAQVEG